jgi:hypothetical protein
MSDLGVHLFNLWVMPKFELDRKKERKAKFKMEIEIKKKKNLFLPFHSLSVLPSLPPRPPS